jgi:hypothetical protein
MQELKGLSISSQQFSLAVGVDIGVSSGGAIEICLAGRPLLGFHSESGSELLALSYFAKPITLQEVVRHLVVSGHCGDTGVARMVQLSTFMKWVGLGLLTSRSLRPYKHVPSATGYDSLALVKACLSDRERTLAAIEGVRRTIRPGDVVVDIGSGSGVLGLAALNAGARHVYAIEPHAIAPLALELAKANGFENRLTVIQSNSQEAELPELADVMCSELVSNDPFGEGVLDVVLDARQRLLKRDAKILPAKLRIYAKLIELPIDYHQKHFSPSEWLSGWEADYGINFAPLLKYFSPAKYNPATLCAPSKLAGYKSLSREALLVEINFSDSSLDPQGDESWSAELAVMEVSSRAVVLSYFELDYGGGAVYSNAPDKARGYAMRNCRIFFDPSWEVLSEGQIVKAALHRHGKSSTLRAHN